MKIKRIFMGLLAAAVVVSTMAASALADDTATTGAALIAGEGRYVDTLPEAFTATGNPAMKQVLMAKDWIGDIEIKYPGFGSSFYINGYTLDGDLTVTEASIVNLYGIEPGNAWAGDDSIITGTVYQNSTANINVGGDITFVGENGVSLVATDGKVIINSDNVTFEGDIKSTDFAIVKITAGTYNGRFTIDKATNLEITGGTFKNDPSDFLPAGYSAVLGSDNMYTIQEPADTLDGIEQNEEGYYVLKNATEVITFRNVMSKDGGCGNFILANDIDMNGAVLAPAGNDSVRYSGIFDGNGKKISNFSIEDSDASYVAFFGNTSGATIKNLTLENVTVVGGEYTAGIVGRARNTTITNCKVIGDIAITGNDAVGAVVGGGVANVTNCTVEGDEGSFITGKWDVAGVSGLVSAGTTKVDGNSVSGVTITATSGYAGGIAGRVLANSTSGNNLSISGNALEDTTIASGDSYSSGIILGATVAGDNSIVSYTDNAVEDTVLTVDGVESNVLYAGTADSNNITIPVAKIGTVYYATLKDAIKDVTDGTTIELIATVEEGAIKLPAVLRNFTINGNGMTVKDTTINAADGNSVDYQGFTVMDTVFDNSRFVLGGQRGGNVIYKNLIFTGNTFKNIVNTGSLAAIHMNIASEDNEYVENFTFTGNTIDGVTGSSNSGLVLKELKGDIVFEGNIITNVAFNAVQIATAKPDANVVIKNNSFTSGGSSVLNIAAAPKVTLINNEVVNTSGRIGVWYPAEAKIGDVLYTDLKTAIADATETDTVTLVSDVTLSDVLAYADRNASTWNGSYAFDIRVTKSITLDLAGYTIKSTGGSDVQHYAIICVDGAGNLTIEDSSADKTGKIINETTSKPAGKMNVVLYSEAGDITLNGGTYINGARVDGNYPYVIDSITAGDASLTISDGVKLVSDGYMTLRAMSQGGAGTQTVNINGGEFDGGIWVVLKNGVKDVMNFNVKDGTFNAESALIIENYAAPAEGSTADAVSITGGTFNGTVGIGANNVGGLLADGFISGGIYVNDVSEYTIAGLTAVAQYEGKYVIIDENLKVEAIEVKLEEVTENVPEGEKLYNINLVATDSDIINRLNSADLTFEISNTTGKTAFEIIASNSEVSVSPVNNSAVRYEFHYEGKDGVTTDTANTITIGQVKFYGYGVFTFAVDTDATTNAAHATKLYDNIVDTFLPNGDEGVQNGELVIDNSAITTEILVPTRDLVINIDFPNAIENKIAAYQKMTVTVSGADLEKDITVELGIDGAITNVADFVTKTSTEKAITASFDGAYTVTVTDLLTVNTSYTVTVEGAGYRTYRYTVTMTDDKTLNFWNNVKDNETTVEEGKKTEKVTYLAGDIVKDSLINIYDLSAVVSYFGETELVGNNNDYAKYDLNRDGKIDSKDVAYVLVSWGK